MASTRSFMALCLAIACTAGGRVARAAEAPSFVEDGILRVCTAGDFPPLQYYKQAGDKDLVGYEVDVVDALAKQWNARAEYIVTDFKGLLPSLEARRCGLVASGILILPERLARYDGVGHLKTSIVLVTPTGSDVKLPDQLSGKTIAIEDGAPGYAKIADDLNRKFAAEGRPQMVVQTYSGATPVIEQILIGRAAATITQDTTAAFRGTQVPGRLTVPYTYDGSETYGLYIRKNAENLDKLKSALASLKRSGTIGELLHKWNLPGFSADVDEKAN